MVEAEKTISAEELIDELSSFRGTELWYRHTLGCLYTEGIKHLAQKAEAFWLLDAVCSYQSQLKGIDFQLWRLERTTGKSFELSCREERNTNILVRQFIDFSDFPLDVFEFYCITRIILLKSEN